MTTILVTGGAGFVGSHTCKALSARGYLPVSYDNLSTGHEDFVRWGPLERGDVRDVSRLKACLGHYRPDAVIHFAASAYVGESMTDPAGYFDNNVGGMMAVLNACRLHEVGRVIFSSSCAVYGVPDSLPIGENTPPAPINPYGRTKLIGEQMLADYARAYGLSYVALRYFNAAGADPEGELTERHDPETHLIPRALMAAAGQIPQVEVFGGDYDTPDGTALRDFIHVSDLAEAHVLALRYLESGGPPTSLNVGTGKAASVQEILSLITEVTGRPVPYRMRPRRPGDPAALVADSFQAHRVLGFTPRYPNPADLIRTAAPAFNRMAEAEA